MPEIEQAQTWLDRGAAASHEARHEDAERAFLRALALDPNLAEASLGLGLACMAQRRFPEAVEPLRVAAASPGAPGSWWACLAQGLYMTGDFAGCAEAFDQAAHLEPLGENARLTQVQARCLAAMIEGRIDDSLRDYAAQTGASAEAVIAFTQEASAILAVFGHAEAAAAVGRRQAPSDPVQTYRLQALEGASLDRAPADYVEAHFDAFAERFDHQLVQMLNYDAPAELAALVARHRSDFAEALDLGCGTGLAAEPLSPLVRRLTGVDLSGGMLARAEAKGVYDDLVQAEAVAFLVDRPAAFDLVFAADVLIYFGDLEPLFAAVARALRPSGCFAFTTERGADDWSLLTSGRFAHADAYIDRLAAPAFKVMARTSTRLRQEGGVGVEGTLHLLVLV